MKLTKYEHACVVIEEQGKKLVIDPGIFAASLTNVGNVAGVIITHEHQDHFDPALLARILTDNPSAQIIAGQRVADQLPDKAVQVVTADGVASIGPFELHFYGGQHALIHPSIPRAANLGVFVNHTLYYPGDSFVIPDQPTKILALPVNAPWMKMAEAMDFLSQVKPQIAFPTHNAFLSEAGQKLANRLIEGLAPSLNVAYQPLDVAEQLVLN